METYGRVAALPIHLCAHGERGKRSFISSIPLFLLYSFVFPPVLINGQKKEGKCVLEILRNFICRNGIPDGTGV